MSYTIRIFIACMGLCIVSSCSKQEATGVVSSDNTPITSNAEAMKGFTLEEFSHGKKVWKLIGVSATLNTDTNILSVEEPHIDIFENKKKVSEMTARHADINTETKNIFARGNVRMISYKDAVSVYAETMTFDNSLNKFFSNGFVRLDRGDSITTGIGLEATKDLSEVIIKDNVNITYKGN